MHLIHVYCYVANVSDAVFSCCKYDVLQYLNCMTVSCYYALKNIKQNSLEALWEYSIIKEDAHSKFVLLLPMLSQHSCRRAIRFLLQFMHHLNQ